MITIYQIQMSDSQIDAFNAGHSIPSIEAKRILMFGSKKFTPDMLQYFTAVAKVDTDDLEDAFAITNIWNEAWKVDRIAETMSSTSVGDIFGQNGRFYMVDSFGFTELKLFNDEVEMLEAV